MSKKNKILLFFSVIIITIIFTPLFGRLYELIIGHKLSSGFWGLSNPEYFEGFIMSFLFFSSFLSWLFFSENKKYWLYYTLPFLIFLLILGAFEGLIIGLGFAIIAWLLAQGILLIYKKFKKT